MQADLDRRLDLVERMLSGLIETRQFVRAFENLLFFYDHIDAACLSIRHLGRIEALVRSCLQDEGSAQERGVVFMDRLGETVSQLITSNAYQQALPLAERAVEFGSDLVGPVQLIGHLMNLGVLYDSLERFVEAERAFHRGLALCVDEAGPPLAGWFQVRIATTQIKLASKTGNTRAVERADERLNEAERLFGCQPEHPLSDMGKEAAKHLRTVIAEGRRSIEEQHVEDDPVVWTVRLGSLVCASLKAGAYAEAEALFVQILKGGSVWRPETNSVITSLNNLALFAKRAGNYAEADNLYTMALTHAIAAYGESNERVALISGNLGRLYSEVGNNEQARSHLQRAVDIYHVSKHPRLLTALNNLVDHLRSRHSPAIALPVLREALQIAEQNPPEQQHPVTLLHHNAGIILSELGDYGGARHHLERAVSLGTEVLGETHPDVLNSKTILLELGAEPTSAIPLARSRRQKLLQLHSEHHPDFIVATVGLAKFLMNGSAEEREEAERLLTQLRNTLLTSGVGSRKQLLVVQMLALCQHLKGNYTEAERLYRAAIFNAKLEFSENHPFVADLYSNLAATLAGLDADEQAMKFMELALEIYDRHRATLFVSGTERQRNQYLALILKDFDAWIQLMVRSGTIVDGPRRILDFVLRHKALGAEARLALHNAVFSGRYPEVAPEIEQLVVVSNRMGKALYAEESTKSQLSEMEKVREELELAIAQRIPEMELNRRLAKVDRAQIAQSLPPQSSFVEFVRFQEYDFGWTENAERKHRVTYLAIVMHAGDPENVHLVKLGAGEIIDWRIALFRHSITGEFEFPDPSDTVREAKRELLPEFRKDPGEGLYEDLIKPLLPLLGTHRRLILAPDGYLVRLPFDALPIPNGRRIIDDFTISYIATARDLVRSECEDVAPRSLPVVIADPAYDLHCPPIANQSPQFVALEGTRREGELVAQLLGVVPWMGNEARAARLREVRGPGIMHLATHGYALRRHSVTHEFAISLLHHMFEQSHDEPPKAIRDVTSLEDPLLRSGLAFAGANSWLVDRSIGSAESLLTADEILGMDLRGTCLVVLSACETGLGDVTAWEGVFGMRRTFQLAGAKTVIASLWKVPDVQTQTLMLAMYRHLLDGQSRVDALRQAQLAVKEQYPDPRNWAGFICLGDPRPIEWLRDARLTYRLEAKH
jgi:CHAT domain-containing protein/tetratricopeptide (TPR) repeat protein